MSEVKGILLARAHTNMPKLSVNKTLPQQITESIQIQSRYITVGPHLYQSQKLERRFVMLSNST